MEYAFYIQDPTDPDTLYLYEAIIDQVTKGTLESWRGIFAFATGRGVRSLFIEEPSVASFARSGEVSLIVGLDAVTDVAALEELQNLTRTYERFEAKVFFNSGTGLFHPKISHFRHGGGHSTLIVGSCNLTPGGLRRNIEAFSIVTGDDSELSSLIRWDEFLQRHANNIRQIDDQALEEARQNVVIARSRRKKEREVEPEAVPAEVEDEIEEEQDAQDARVLVAQVPKAGARWHQVHFNKDVIDKFFRIKHGSPQRLFLRERRRDSSSTGPEEVRPVVYAPANKNYKIEISARRGEAYPSAGPPIIIFKELGLRNFRYLLLMPGDEGYEEMMDFTNSHESIGKGKARILTSFSEVLRAWPECPL